MNIVQSHLRLLFFLIKFCLNMSKRNIFKKNKKVQVDDRSNLESNGNCMDKSVIFSYKEFFCGYTWFFYKGTRTLALVYNTDYKCWIINWSANFSKKLFCKTIKIYLFLIYFLLALNILISLQYSSLIIFDYLGNQILVEIL